MDETLLDRLAARFDAPGVKALVLAGSHARGDAGPYSDVDLMRFVAAHDARPAEPGSYLLEGRLVVVSDVTQAAVERWFDAPEEAVKVVAGLRCAKPLFDREGTFAAVQKRAREFVWDESMQRKADAWASREMVGWIEEVHKGLEGLRRDDPGRLLHACFGCSWGLSRVVQVQRGVLLSGDNAFYDEVAEAVGRDSEWVRLWRRAFGVAGRDGACVPLRERVKAGLRLYALTAAMLAETLEPGDRPLVDETAKLIRQVLGDAT